VTECPGISAGNVDAFALGYSPSKSKPYCIFKRPKYQIQIFVIQAFTLAYLAQIIVAQKKPSMAPQGDIKGS
jgi:hypothetical protein